MIPKDIKLQISPIDTLIISDLTVKCNLSSETSNITILNWNEVSTSASREYLWFADIYYYKTGKRKILPFIFLGDLDFPTANDYIKIKSGEVGKIIISINFLELRDSDKHTLDGHNVDYGDYHITITYQDFFCKHVKHVNCLRGKIVSNTIKVTYKKN